MAIITFKKFERDCPHNEKAREKGEKKGIIYDYEIWGNGEKKGVFQASYPRKYYLVDNGGHYVKKVLEEFTTVKNRINSVVANNKESFGRIYEDFKKHIPSPQQIAEREAEKQKEEDAKEERQRQEHILWIKKQAATEMYEALKNMLSVFNKEGFLPKGSIGEKVCMKAEEAIEKAEGK